MDSQTGQFTGDPVVISSLGWEVSDAAWELLKSGGSLPPAGRFVHDCRPSGYLKVRKTLKFMSKQDRLALSAAGKVLAGGGINARDLVLQCGVFMSVGYIPFQREEAESLCIKSQKDNHFCMETFTTEAYDIIHPLRAFSCLPNMPAHHIAANFDLQGQYFITYPGSEELRMALVEAVARLHEGSIDYALVGGVADQTNFLVENHYAKTMPNMNPCLADGAGFMLLESEKQALERKCQPLARLNDLLEKVKPGEQSEIETCFGAAFIPLKFAVLVYEQNNESIMEVK